MGSIRCVQPGLEFASSDQNLDLASEFASGGIKEYMAYSMVTRTLYRRDRAGRWSSKLLYDALAHPEFGVEVTIEMTLVLYHGLSPGDPRSIAYERVSHASYLQVLTITN